MIKSFRHKGLELLYRSDSVKGIQPAHKDRLDKLLSALDAAQEPEALNLPGFNLHKLKGKLSDHWSLRVTGNWRITFRFIGEDVELVDYTDYH